ncbi:S-adenosyl-L-methionine-dependent methyltransferase superfamily protein [Abeliophyllum distichum]|uniref:Trimethylguanosine synthase n=1 Tax=Abeliophyllum distichum TaxID=126358 RepID=A0ABD1SBW8_9LAMI
MDGAEPIKALGSLFKFTEVYLWDNDPTEVREIPYFQEPAKRIGDDDFEKNENDGLTELHSLTEDVELAKQLNELGLPLSFQTNKERNGKVSGKRKDTRKKNRLSLNDIDVKELDSIKVSEVERSVDILHDNAMLNQNEILKYDVMDIDGFHNLCSEGKDLDCSSACCTCALLNERDCNDEVSDLKFDHDLDCSSEFSKVLLNEFSETNTSPCINDMVAVASPYLDILTSAGSSLLSDSAVCDDNELKEPALESVHLESPSAVDRQTEGVKHTNEIGSDMIQDHDSAAHSQFSEVVNSDITDSRCKGDSGEWITCWDDVYMRSYFYNVKTKESTWDLPSGMEDLELGIIANELKMTAVEMAELDDNFPDFSKSDEVRVSCGLQPNLVFAEEYRDDNGLDQLCGETLESYLFAENFSSTNTAKRKKKVRRTKSNRNLSISSEELQGTLEEFSPSIGKYWSQRYLLFSRYDDGIKMDEEGWFSVTPEPIAKHHASRCGSGSIVDFFTGVGGNAIQFAQRSKHVIAIDIDPNKIGYAQHNAALYEVDDRIDFIRGDSFCLAPRLKADIVFMSPPWGGPDYAKVKKFDINTMLKPHDGQFLFNAGKEIASRIIMFLPRNVDISQLAELSLSASPPWSLEVEKNFLNGRFKAITAYFSAPALS